jgi:hypothetical protein
MLLIHLLQTVIQFLLENPNLFVVISFFMVVLFFGKHTRRLLSVTLHVRQKLRLQMNVLKMLKYFIIYYLIYIYVLVVRPQMLLIGLILSVLRVCVILISEKTLFAKHNNYERFLFHMFLAKILLISLPKNLNQIALFVWSETSFCFHLCAV